MTRSDGYPSFADAVAGGPVRGSWWTHPRAGRIFRLSNVLHDSREVLAVKLVQGKVTFLHEALWPPLARVVTDDGWRKSIRSRLSPGAAGLLRAVERRGTLRLDKATIKSGKELEPTLLVHTGSVHTEKGSHATVLTSWKKFFDARTLALSKQLSLDEAKSRLGL